MDDSLRLAASDFGVRWQAQRDTALARVAKGWPVCQTGRPVAKAPSLLRSAGALHRGRVSSMPRTPEYVRAHWNPPPSGQAIYRIDLLP